MCTVVHEGIGNGKIRPVTCHQGTDGELRHSSTLPLTLALDGGGCLRLCPGRFTRGKGTIYPLEEPGWAPGPVWIPRKISHPPGLEP
jgi:hypothetical protein